MLPILISRIENLSSSSPFEISTFMIKLVAEREGFEPPGRFCRPSVFKTGLVNHLSTSPIIHKDFLYFYHG